MCRHIYFKIDISQDDVLASDVFKTFEVHRGFGEDLESKQIIHSSQLTSLNIQTCQLQYSSLAVTQAKGSPYSLEIIFFLYSAFFFVYDFR